MQLRVFLIGFALACSGEVDPELTSPQQPIATPALSGSVSSGEAAAAAEEEEERSVEAPLRMVAGTLRLVVLRPETLLQTEERWLSHMMELLDASELRVLRDEPSAGEGSALSALFSGGDWTRPAEWAQHDVVLALEFAEPVMRGRREVRPYTLGLRNVALWSTGEEEPAYQQTSRLTHGRSITSLDTPSEVSELLVQLALDARSGS